MVEKSVEKADYPMETLEIHEPDRIVLILHEKKMKILKSILNEGKTIQQIKKTTGINPGTIKRHLDALKSEGLVFIESKKLNDYNILMKFYRAIAKKFEISTEIP